MTIRFLLRGSGEKATIQVYVSVARGKNFRNSTGIEIERSQWNEKENLPKIKLDKSKEIRQILKNLSIEIEKKYFEQINNKKNFDEDWLKNILDVFFQKEKQTVFFTDFVTQYIEKAPTMQNKKGGVGLSKNHILSLKSFEKKFLEFESFNRKRIKVLDITKQTPIQYKNFLIQKGYKTSSVSLYLRIFKLICNYIETVTDYSFSHQTKHFKIVNDVVKDHEKINLNFKELDQIAQTEISQELQTAKKWLLLGCELGQRISDLLVLTPNDIKLFKEFEYFEITQKKTGKVVFVPINKRAKKILETGFPKKISYLKFQSDIKEICRLAQINQEVTGVVKKDKEIHSHKITAEKWRFVSSHICRRSFATNYFGIIPTSLLKTITGHSTEEMLLRYIGKKPQDNLELLFSSMVQKEI